VLGKLIGILHEIVSGARRIAILLNESNPLHAAYWARAQGACAALDSLRCALSQARPRKSALRSSRWFGNDRRPSS
jgi:hypothetical protein